MKRFMVAMAGLGILAVSALAQEKEAPKANTDSKDITPKASYAIGLDLGKRVKAQSVEIDIDQFVQGLRDAMAGKPKLNDQEIRDVMIAFQQFQLEQHKKKGEEYLAQNKKKPGVKTTASGLQYEVLREGTGAMPKATDSVKVNYEGRLIDGTVFDSSYKRGEPASFQCNQVIKGWTEALQLMKVGSKYKLYIPSELAYGAHPRGGPGSLIKPHDPLIFEVELLGIE